MRHLASGNTYYRHLTNKSVPWMVLHLIADDAASLKRIAQANRDYMTAVAEMRVRTLLPAIGVCRGQPEDRDADSVLVPEWPIRPAGPTQCPLPDDGQAGVGGKRRLHSPTEPHVPDHS